MTNFKNCVLAALVLLPASSAFVLPSSSTTPLSALALAPDGTTDWMLRGAQNGEDYNKNPNPVRARPRQPPPQQQYQPNRRISQMEAQARGGGPGPVVPGPNNRNNMNMNGMQEQDSYRPRRKFDQNDPFVSTPYGQDAPLNGPPRVRLERARGGGQWKEDQNRQDAFINGAYGSGGVGRYGHDINGASKSVGGARRNASPSYTDPKARQQEDFINNPYGSKGAPGFPTAPNNSGYERYRKPASMPVDDFDQGAPKYERYKPRAERRPEQDNIQANYERFRPERPPALDENGPQFEYRSERRSREGPPPGGPRLERYDPRDERMYHDRSSSDFVERTSGENAMHYQDGSRSNARRFDPRQDPRQRYAQENDLIERSPNSPKRRDFDPRDYEARQVRSPEEREFEDRNRERMQQEAFRRLNAQEEFINNPNGSSFRPSRYGHGNDGDNVGGARNARYDDGGW